MDIDAFRQGHIDLLSRSPNCSEGYIWIWRRLGQCLENTEQTLGFISGIIAVFLWTVAHVTIYKIQRRVSRVERRCNSRTFVAFHWFSDILSCVGAVLAQQLVSQIVFSLSAVFIDTICGIHSIWIPQTVIQKNKRKVYKYKKVSPGLRKFLKCLYPLVMLFPLVSLFGVADSGLAATKRDIMSIQISQYMIPIFWMVGYSFGALAGILYCSAKVVELLDAYRTTDFDCSIGCSYSCSILTEITYVFSVYTQSHSLGFFFHALPWTLPRLISAGLDLGIIFQRCIQKRRTKGRRLSKQDTECLLSSSDNDYADISSSGSEEIIWQPLKIVDAAIPMHPVCTSRVQFLSESEGFSDKTDYLCDTALRSPPVETNKDDTEDDNIQTGKEEEIPLLKDNPKPDNASYKDDSSAEVTLDKNSVDSQTNSDSDDSTSDDREAVLERQISNLSAVSSEEKIAVWIQSNSDSGEQSIKCSLKDP